MSDTDISTAAVERLLDCVTAGPWVAVFDRRTWGWLEIDGPSFNIGCPTRATDLSLADEVQRKTDARFIAASRDLVPALLADRDRLAAEVARMREALTKLRDLMCEAIEDDDGNSGCGQCDHDCTGCIAHAALQEGKA